MQVVVLSLKGFCQVFLQSVKSWDFLSEKEFYLKKTHSDGLFDGNSDGNAKCFMASGHFSSLHGERFILALA